jgi:hypothetical protein
MDELRTTIFSSIFSRALQRLLTEALQPGERVLWQGQPDGVARMMMWLHDLQTLFAVTNRRALIVRTAWGKQTVSATRFEDMDKTFELADIGRGAGHLNFASGRSTRSPDTDYSGRYGFRCVRNPSGVGDILERARRRTP